MSNGASAVRRVELAEAERRYYSLNRRVYGRIGAWVYDALVPLRRLRREVVNVAGLAPGSRVLDVATGTGAEALAFAETAGEVVGVDLSEAMLRVARRKNHFTHVAFQRGDASALPYEDAGFDATCISFALHEMPLGVRERVVREMARVTRSGGVVIVVDYGLPNKRVARWLAYHLVKLYEPEPYVDFVKSDVGTLLRSAGLDLVQRHPALGGLALIVTARKP